MSYVILLSNRVASKEEEMSFSQMAVDFMNKRISNHKNKVGSQLKKAQPKLYQSYESTDCITFVLNVLKDTFIGMKSKEVANALTSYGMAAREPGKGKKFYGDLLANSLVTKHGWAGIYLSPDKFHPTDADKEHTFATNRVLKKCKYASIPVSYTVIDYKPLKKSDPNFQALFPFKERKINVLDLDAVKKIKFGFGISRGGMHTWLYSEGFVYEVHWDKKGSELYDKTNITFFPWQSNLIVVPPDAKPSLTMSSVKCK